MIYCILCLSKGKGLNGLDENIIERYKGVLVYSRYIYLLVKNKINKYNKNVFLLLFVLNVSYTSKYIIYITNSVKLFDFY